MSPKKTTEKGTRGSRHAPPTNAFPKGHPGGPGRPKLTDEERRAREMVAAFQPEGIELLIAHARGDDARISLDALKHLTPWLAKLKVDLGGEEGEALTVVVQSLATKAGES